MLTRNASAPSSRRRRMGVVTSADAYAARRAACSARWPMVEVVVFPTLVQAPERAPQIVAALGRGNRYSPR
ncbi:MAG: hypothetical protein R3A10_13815 [Caldilineaceae bacterium]